MRDVSATAASGRGAAGAEMSAATMAAAFCRAGGTVKKAMPRAASRTVAVRSLGGEGGALVQARSGRGASTTVAASSSNGAAQAVGSPPSAMSKRSSDEWARA